MVTQILRTECEYLRIIRCFKKVDTEGEKIFTPGINICFNNVGQRTKERRKGKVERESEVDHGKRNKHMFHI